MSHAESLRSFWGPEPDQVDALARVLAAAGADAAELPLREGLPRIEGALSSLAGLDDADRALLSLTARIALAPRTLRAGHLAPLRAAGLDDRALHDVVHVVSCFSYMNRLADGLGVAVPSERFERARSIFGDAALTAHLAWSRGEG